MAAHLHKDESLTLRRIARALAIQQGSSGIAIAEVVRGEDSSSIDAVLESTAALFDRGLVDGVEVAEKSYPVRITQITAEGQAALRALRKQDRDSVLVALYEATAGDPTLQRSRSELSQLVGIPYEDLSAAENVLLDQGLVRGTMGGEGGFVSLTPSGVVEAEEVLEVQSEGSESLMTPTNNGPRQLLDVIAMELAALEREPWSSAAKGWKIKAMDVLRRIDAGDDLVQQIQAVDFAPYVKRLGVQFAPSGWSETFEQARADARQVLEATRFRLTLNETLTSTTSDEALLGKSKVFIGHGRSPLWRELKDFIRDRLGLEVDEFNSVATAGVHTAERLEDMLQSAAMAFLVMTAEDERSGGLAAPRLNVVHEAGLFQGRLGFRRAIVLLEQGCEEFSNIHGLGQIRFPEGDISAKFEEVRRVLEREGLLDSS